MDEAYKQKLSAPVHSTLLYGFDPYLFLNEFAKQSYVIDFQEAFWPLFNVYYFCPGCSIDWSKYLMFHGV